MAVYPTRRRFTVAEYCRMAQAGVLGEDDRVELVDGEVTEMTPVGPRHAGCVIRLENCLSQIAKGAALVSTQNPLRLDDTNLPQPDLALLRPRADRYASRYPISADVLLLVEVGESTLEFDRKVKVPLYARHGIAELWLIDLDQEMVTVYREPQPDGYRLVRVLRRGEVLEAGSLPEVKLAVADIFD